MPRSRSMSFESITRSATFSCAAKVPDWRSSQSTSVVLPWSTWAMMAMLRICWVMGSHGSVIASKAVCWISIGLSSRPGISSPAFDVGGAEEGARLVP